MEPEPSPNIHRPCSSLNHQRILIRTMIEDATTRRTQQQHGCVVHRGIVVSLTQSRIRPLLPSLFPVKGTNKERMHGGEPPGAQTEQHPWLHPGWKILPTRIGYCLNTNCANLFRREDNNVTFTHVQPHYHRVRQVESCHHLG